MKKKRIGEKAKNMMHGFIRYIKPVQNNGILSTYQKTYIYSSWVSLSLIIFACIIEMTGRRSHWLIFIQNLMIGTTCSLLVVIITSIIQFRTEQARKIEECLSALFFVAHNLHLASITDDEDKNDDKAYQLFSDLKKAYREYRRASDGLFWLREDKQIKFSQMEIDIIVVCNSLGLERGKGSLRALRMLDKKRVNSIIDTAIEIAEENDKTYGEMMKTIR